MKDNTNNGRDFSLPFNSIEEMAEQSRVREEQIEAMNNRKGNARNFAETVWYGGLKGATTGLALVNEFLGQTDDTSTLAELGGISEEDYISNLKANLGEEAANARINRIEKEHEDFVAKAKVISDIYKEYDDSQVRAIASISNRPLQFTAGLAGGFAEGIGNFIEVPKNIALNVLTGGAATALGLGKWGTIGLEYGTDFVDNYISQFHEAKALLQEDPTATDAAKNAAYGLALQAVMGSGKAIINKGLESIGMTTKIPEYSTKVDDSATATSKEVAKKIIQANNPDKDVELQLFQIKMEDPTVHYEPSLDPRNTRDGVMEKLYDPDIENSPTVMYVERDNHTQLKLNFDNEVLQEIRQDAKDGRLPSDIAEKLIDIDTLNSKMNVLDGNNINSHTISTDNLSDLKDELGDLVAQDKLDEAERLLNELRINQSKQEGKVEAPIKDRVQGIIGAIQEEIDRRTNNDINVKQLRDEFTNPTNNIEDVTKKINDLHTETVERANNMGISNKPFEIPDNAPPSQGLSTPSYVTNEQKARQVLLSNATAVGQSYCVINPTSKERTLLFKDADGSLVSITYNDIKLKDTALNNPDIVNKSQDELWMDITKYTSRVEKIDKDGNVISVNGNAKNKYYAKYKEYYLKDLLARKLSDSGHEYQDIKSQNDSGRTKTNIDRTVTDMANMVIQLINKNKLAVTRSTKEYFDSLFKGTFKDYDDLLSKTYEILPELLVRGESEVEYFRNQNMPAETREQLNKFVQYLISRDTKVAAMNKSLELTPMEISAMDFQKSNNIYKVDAEGNLTYNTDEGGLFHGVDPRAKIIELTVNQHQISEGKYKGYLEDVQLFQQLVIGRDTIDRQNAMAIELALRDDADKINFADSLGFFNKTVDGELLVTVDSFISGLQRVMNELNNPNSLMDKEKLLQLVNDLGNENILPQREHVNKSGTRENLPMKPIDFILFNAEGTRVDKTKLFNLFQQSINALDDYINDILRGEGRLNVIEALGAKEREQVGKLAQQSMQILDTFHKVISSENRANKYFGTEKYSKLQADVIDKLTKLKDAGYVEFDPEELLAMKQPKYNGTITVDNFKDVVKQSIDDTKEIQGANTKAHEKITSLLEKLGKKKKTLDLMSDDFYKNYILDISDIAVEKLGYTVEDVAKLRDLEAPVVRRMLKEIDQKLNDPTKRVDKATNLLDTIDLNDTNKSSVTNKLIGELESLGVENLSQIKEFVDYHYGNVDSKMDKETWLKNLDDIREQLSVVIDNRDENYKNKKQDYTAIEKAYMSLRDLINQDVSLSSLKFLRKPQKDALLKATADLDSVSKKLGVNTDQLKSAISMMNNIVEILDLVEESKIGSPVIKRQRGNIEMFARVTNDEMLKFGRMEGVIRKDAWLEDKAMFVRVTPEQIAAAQAKGYKMTESTIALELKAWNDLSQVEEGTFANYIKPEYQERFKRLYEYALQFMPEVEEVQGDKIVPRPMNIDEFTYTYVQLLRGLSQTTQNARTQSALPPTKTPENIKATSSESLLGDMGSSEYASLDRSNPLKSVMYLKSLVPYFKDEDNMIAFFTRRSQQNGRAYTKLGADLLYKYINKHGEALGEISATGNFLARFAYQLKAGDKVMNSLIGKHEPIIVKEDGSIIERAKNTVTSNMQVALGSKLSNYSRAVYGGSGVKGYSDFEVTYQNILKWVLRATRDTVLMGKGVPEIMYNPLRTLNTAMPVDEYGKVTGSKNLTTHSLKRLRAATRGIGWGAMVASTVPWNMGVSTANIAGKFLKYLKAEDVVNKVLSKYGVAPIELQAPNGAHITPLDIWKRLHPKQKELYSAISNYFEIRDLNKSMNMNDFDPSDYKLIGGDKGELRQYIARGLSSVYDMYSRKANLIQEYSDMHRWIESYQAVTDIIKDMSTKSYKDLSVKGKSWLHAMGIDETAYPRLQETIGKMKNEDGTFNHINILSPVLSDKDIPIDEYMKIDEVVSLANTIFGEIFDQQKNSKFNPRDKFNLLSEVLLALRVTPFRIAETDINDVFYKTTEYGTYKSKRSSYEDTGAAPTLSQKVGKDLSGLSSLLGYLAIGMTLPIVKKLGENAYEASLEYLNLKAGIEEWSAVVEDEDQDWKYKFVRSIGLFKELVGEAMLQNAPVLGVFSGGSLLESTGNLFKSTVSDFLELAYPVLGLDSSDANKVLKRLGIDSDYNEFRAENTPFLARFSSFIGSLLSETILRTDTHALKAFTEEGKSELGAKFLKRQSHNRLFGDRAGAKYSYNTYKEDREERKNRFVNMFKNLSNTLTAEEESSAKSIYERYTGDLKETFQSQADSLSSLSLALTEGMKEQGKITEKEAEAKKVQILNSLNIDDEISKLPSAYQYVIKRVLDTQDRLKESEELQLKGYLLQASLNKENLQDIYNAYANIEGNNRPHYDSYESIPSFFKYKQKQLQKVGVKISDEELLKKLNSPSGMDWLSQMFNQQGEVELPEIEPVQHYTMSELLSPSLEVSSNGTIKPVGYQPTDEEMGSVISQPDNSMVQMAEAKEISDLLLQEGVFVPLSVEDEKILEIPDSESEIVDQPLKDKTTSESEEDRKKNGSKPQEDITLDRTSIKDIPIDKNSIDADRSFVGLGLDEQKINEIPTELRDKEQDIFETQLIEESDDPKEIAKVEETKIDIANAMEQIQNIGNRIQEWLKVNNNPVEKNLPKETKEVQPKDTKKTAKELVNVIALGRLAGKNQGVVDPQLVEQLVDGIELPNTVKWMLEEMKHKPVTGDTRVKSYFEKTNMPYLTPDNNWCAAILTAAFTNNGHKLKNRTVRAREYDQNGKTIPVSDIKAGDVMQFVRSNGTGHVNMVVYADDNNVICIGGNQSNTDSNERDGAKNTINFKVYPKQSLTQTRNHKYQFIRVE